MNFDVHNFNLVSSARLRFYFRSDHGSLGGCMSNSDLHVVKQLEIVLLEQKKGSLDNSKKVLLSKALILLGTALDSNPTQADRILNLVR